MKSRRPPSQSDYVSNEDVSTVDKLADLMRSVMRRLSLAESQAPRSWIEFELDVDATGTTKYSLTHSMGGPVRYWVTHWGTTAAGTTPVVAPCLRYNTESTSSVLVLTSTVSGRAIIRVESAEFGVT
jgi:hypothetical protein